MHTGFLHGSIFSRDTVLNHIGEILRATSFLGLGVNYLLWGVQIAQSYYYYKAYRTTDRTWMKGAVAFLFVTEALQSIFASIFCWRFMVTGLDVVPDQRIGWAVDILPFFDSVTVSTVHILYAQKIWTLLRSPFNYILTGAVLLLSCTQLVAGLGTTIVTSRIHITFAGLGQFKNWVIVWLTGAAVTDLLITVIMTWKLSSVRTGIKRTDDIISKLIAVIIETGLATALVQIVAVALNLILPLKPYYLALGFLGPKVYSNSMLALLNSRPIRNNETASRHKQTCSHHSHSVGTVSVQNTWPDNGYSATHGFSTNARPVHVPAKNYGLQ